MMTLKSRLSRLALGVSVLFVVGICFGCGSTEPEVKTDPFKASEPPKDWLDAKLKAKEAATPPPTGKPN